MICILFSWGFISATNLNRSRKLSLELNWLQIILIILYFYLYTVFVMSAVLADSLILPSAMYKEISTDSYRHDGRIPSEYLSEYLCIFIKLSLHISKLLHSYHKMVNFIFVAVKQCVVYILLGKFLHTPRGIPEASQAYPRKHCMSVWPMRSWKERTAEAVVKLVPIGYSSLW